MVTSIMSKEMNNLRDVLLHSTNRFEVYSAQKSVVKFLSDSTGFMQEAVELFRALLSQSENPGIVTRALELLRQLLRGSNVALHHAILSALHNELMVTCSSVLKQEHTLFRDITLFEVFSICLKLLKILAKNEKYEFDNYTMFVISFIEANHWCLIDILLVHGIKHYVKRKLLKLLWVLLESYISRDCLKVTFMASFVNVLNKQLCQCDIRAILSQPGFTCFIGHVETQVTNADSHKFISYSAEKGSLINEVKNERHTKQNTPVTSVDTEPNIEDAVEPDFGRRTTNRNESCSSWDAIHVREWSYLCLCVGAAVKVTQTECPLTLVHNIDNIVTEMLRLDASHQFPWLPAVFGDQDDMWIDSLILIMDIVLRSKEDIKHLHYHFLQLVSTLGYDDLVLVDLLTSPETKFREYLVKYLRFLSKTWDVFYMMVSDFQNCSNMGLYQECPGDIKLPSDNYLIGGNAGTSTLVSNVERGLFMNSSCSVMENKLEERIIDSLYDQQICGNNSDPHKATESSNDRDSRTIVDIKSTGLSLIAGSYDDSDYDEDDGTSPVDHDCNSDHVTSLNNASRQECSSDQSHTIPCDTKCHSSTSNDEQHGPLVHVRGKTGASNGNMLVLGTQNAQVDANLHLSSDQSRFCTLLVADIECDEKSSKLVNISNSIAVQSTSTHFDCDMQSNNKNTFCDHEVKTNDALGEEGGSVVGDSINDDDESDDYIVDDDYAINNDADEDSNVVMDRVMGMLIRVRLKLERLQHAGLLPFKSDMLLALLEAVEDRYENN